MISEIPLPAVDASEEIQALIETLLVTEQRLEELTAGEVDTVAGRDGRTFLLRRAQEQLRYSEAAKQARILNELRVLFDVVPAMIWFKDTENRFLRVNRRGAEKTGMSVEYIEGKSAEEVFPQEAAGYYADDLEVIRSGVPKIGIVEKLRGLQGQESWVQTDKVPVFDSDGKVTGLVVLAQDISERKRDEESLRASQANMAVAQRLAHFGSWELKLTSSKDINANVLRWSDEMFRIAGYEPGMVEVSNELFFSLVHPEDRESIRQAVAAAIRERGEYSIVHRLVRADGETRVVQETGQIFFDETTGEPATIVGTAHDITEQRKAEEELRESEETISLTLKAAHFGHWALDLVTHKATRSLQHDQIFGYDELQQDWTFEKFLTHVLAEDRAEVDRQFQAAVAAKTEWNFECRIVRADGAVHWIWANGKVFTNSAGDAVRMLGIVSDITERKRSEDAVQRSQKRLRDLIDGMGPAMFVGLLTLEGILIEVNQAALAAANVKAEDVLGKPFAETPWWSHSPEAQRQLREAIARAARGEASRYDVRTQGAGNEVIDIDFSLQPLRDETGEVAFLIPSASVITERKLAETALRESEAEFRALAEAMPQMVWITRPDGWNLYFSQQWVDYTGLSLEESLGHGWNKPFHPEDRQRAWDAWKHATTTTGVYSIESRLRRADGAYRWWLIRGVPQLDASGKVLKWFGTCTDIHDLKLAELEISRSNRELRLSEEKFQQLAVSVTDVFYVTSPDLQQMHYVSPAYERIWGRSTESLYANPYEWGEAILPEERADVISAFSRLAIDQLSVSAEFRIARPDGTIRWILSRGFGVHDADGKTIRITGIASDITERKYAEDTLRESEERFSGAFEHAPIGVALVSPDGRFSRVNRALCELVGYSEAELLARTFQDITHLEDLALSDENVRRLLDGAERSFQMEKLYVHKRGHLITALLSISLVRDSQGQPSYFIGQIQDITERKKLEAQLLQSQKMEAIGTLAGGIAHDFNNILAAIIGYSEMAQRGISGESSAQAHLEQVLIASNRGRDLILQILAFSRQEEPERERLELQPIIEETLELLRVSLPSTVEIRQNIDPSAPSVLGDATQMQQVIMNLCVNAGQAMKERGGILEVRLTCIDVGHDLASAHPELKEGPHICLTLSDTGCGMERDTKERIFEPFFTTKAPGEGTGLGLAVVHGVIKNHDGVIVVFSELGVGTTFSIYLPVYEGQHALRSGRLGKGRKEKTNGHLYPPGR